ncbi:MAG: hypothetical protein H0U65_13540 [Rubrobacter sp.]|nr:hypothetical protein [Rubrobacter sp.]
MIGKLAGLWPVRRVTVLAVGFWETFLRDNKVVPPVLAVAALFVFAWIVFGSFVGAPEDEPISSQNEVAQSEGAGAAQPTPEIENPNTDSYAAYQSKDPFRQLFQTAESTTQQEDTGGDAGEGADADDPADDPAEDTDDPISDDPGDPADDGFQDPGGGTSTGAPGGGAADDQYENGQTPREDPTDTGGTEDTGSQAPQAPAPQTPAPQTPAPQAPPADSGDNLFDSGGDLEDPYGR